MLKRRSDRQALREAYNAIGRLIAESMGEVDRPEEGVRYDYRSVVDWLDRVATDEDRDTRGIVDEGVLGIGTFFERLSKLGCWVLVKEVFVNEWTSAQTIQYFKRYEDIPETYRIAADAPIDGGSYPLDIVEDWLDGNCTAPDAETRVETANGFYQRVSVIDEWFLVKRRGGDECVVYRFDSETEAAKAAK